MIRRFILSIPLLALAILAPADARAHEFTLQDLVLHHPWARASAGGAKIGVVYLTILNRGNQGDRLIGAATPAAERAELHQAKNAGAVMEMAPIDGIDLAPGSEFKLAPNGAHLMLIGLRHKLKPGDSFPLTLTFAHAGEVALEVEVQGIADLEPSH